MAARTRTSQKPVKIDSTEPQAVEPQAVEPQAVEPQAVEPQAVEPTPDDNVESTSESTPESTEPQAVEIKAPKGKDFTTYATKTPTSLHEHYREWLMEKTGWTPESATKSELTKMVQIAVSCYADFQKSDEHKAWKAEQAAAKASTKPKGTMSPEQIKAKMLELQAMLAASESAESTESTEV